MKYRTVDLCAGIGGIRRGFELTGKFKNVLSAEIDELACQTYEKLFHDNPRNDLTTAEFKNKLASTKYDVLLAGFPCQTFSKVGHQLGFRDKTKGTIFFDIADIIQNTQPKCVLLENVENLVRHDKGQTFNTIITVLEKYLNYKVIGVTTDQNGDLKYNPRDFIRNSKDFGIPQNRPRAYIIAFNRRYFRSHLSVIPNELPKCRKSVPIYTELKEVLESGEVPAHYFLSEGYLETLEKHKTRQNSIGYGFGMKIVNDPMIKQPVASALLATGGSGRERNLIYDPINGEQYAGLAVKGKYSPVNSKCIRMMTPSEWGRLQGFLNYAFLREDGTEGFSFPETVSDVQKYKQFGNSVTIPVIESMADYICECLDKMTSLFVPTEKRLYTMYGTNFLMCSKLFELIEERVRESTYLKWVDAYYYFGIDTPFQTRDLADFLSCSSARGSQILGMLSSIGFAEKLHHRGYQFSSHFIHNTKDNPNSNR